MGWRTTNETDVRDSRGFLWFALTRAFALDIHVYEQTTNTDASSNVTDFLETRAGEFWIGTNAGLVRFNPKGESVNRVVYEGEATSGASSIFTVVVPTDEDRRSRAVAALLEGRDGAVWVGTLKGLYRLERTSGATRCAF